MNSTLKVKEELFRLGFDAISTVRERYGFVFCVFNEEDIKDSFIHFLRPKNSLWRFQYEPKVGFSYWADGRSVWIPIEITDIATMIVLYK